MCRRPRNARPTTAARLRDGPESPPSPLPRHLRRQQPVAVLGEDRRHPDRVVDPEADKPAEQEVLLHLLHQLPLGANREQNLDLDLAGPDQPLRRDRGAPEIGVEHLERRIRVRQHRVDNLPDRARRMPCRDALLEINVAEQRPARPSVPRIFTTAATLRRVNHVIKLLSRLDYFSSLLRASK